MSSSRVATVQDASPSPPPLPKEPILSASSSSVPLDQPITSLGEGDSDEEDEDEDDVVGSRLDGADAGEEEEEEWDPAAETLPGQAQQKGKGKGKQKEADPASAAVTEDGNDGESKPHPWQAVWSEEKNAWYFWNTTSGEVTWTNPLENSASSSSSTSAPPLPPGPVPAAAPAPAPRRIGGGLPEIDPALAFLLPPEARGGSSDPTSQSAMFNARTGRFTANDYMYNVEHLTEYNRMKRMNNQYFDQDAWERDMALHNAKRKRDEEAGVVPKQLSKKDMERFRKKKQEKRLRGQAWLRD